MDAFAPFPDTPTLHAVRAALTAGSRAELGGLWGSSLPLAAWGLAAREGCAALLILPTEEEALAAFSDLRTACDLAGRHGPRPRWFPEHQELPAADDPGNPEIAAARFQALEAVQGDCGFRNADFGSQSVPVPENAGRKDRARAGARTSRKRQRRPSERARARAFPEPEAQSLKPNRARARAGAGAGDAHSALRTPQSGPPLIVGSLAAFVQPVPQPAALADATLTLTVGARYPRAELRALLEARGFTFLPRVEAPGDVALRGEILDVFPRGAEHPYRLEFLDDQLEGLRRFDAVTQAALATLDRATLVLAKAAAFGLSPEAVAHGPTLLEAAGVPLLVCQAHRKTARERLLYQDTLTPELRLGPRLRAFERASAAHRRLALESLPVIEGPQAANLRVETLQRFDPEGRRLDETLVALGAGGRRVFLLAGADDEDPATGAGSAVAALAALLARHDLAPNERRRVVSGTLERGFACVEWGLAFVNRHELFGGRRPAGAAVRGRANRTRGAPIEDFLDLAPGDYVVHLAHGIGRFAGLERLRQEGRVEEFLVLEYQGGAKLYVPPAKIDLVQRYLGLTRRAPRLDRLGGRAWRSRRERAERAVRDLAAELLETQARRRRFPGFAFPPDDDEQRRFRASFAWPDTPDQEGATRAVAADMEAPRPMDRLLCGDVGFGKTEIAVRAAFKAAQAGRQTALLAPTTILAQQHGDTFAARFADTGVSVAVLSRFQTPAEQRAVLARAADGRLDVLIGTHRLLSGDVRLPRLGLVIVDEEQRFGVADKERMKRWRATVDLLTLTATPIPRTLHGALVGLRDISTLASPPPDRLSVHTEVARQSDALVQRGIERELARGGQLFYLHNRISELPLLERRLQRLAPAARIAVLHGRLAEDLLAARMRAFQRGGSDLLLCTTIIASGIDIPNANTLFVHRADRFGLADLHQLRGRVGRSDRRAYAYFLLPPDMPLREAAEKRLRALEEFHHLGAGFQLALKDLEIRGAGNLLGTQQSGHVAAVGYELYCRLLGRAVKTLRHEPLAEPAEVSLDLRIEALLPESYVGDERSRVELYRRLGMLAGREGVAAFRAELADRFGPPPPPVLILLRRAALHQRCAAAGIAACVRLGESLEVRFADPGATPAGDPAATVARRAALLAPVGARARAHGDRTVFVRLSEAERTPEGLLDFLEGWDWAAVGEV